MIPMQLEALQLGWSDDDPLFADVYGSDCSSFTVMQITKNERRHGRR